MHKLASAPKNANRMPFVVADAVQLMHAAYGFVVICCYACWVLNLWGGLHMTAHMGGGYLPHAAVALRSPIEGRGQRGRCRGAATD